MKRIHYFPSEFLRRSDPLSIIVAGAGGTGSLLIAELARMNQAVLALGGKGIMLIAYDPSVVTINSYSRQLFHSREIGQNKAKVIIDKVRRTYGFGWDYKPMPLNLETFNSLHFNDNNSANLIITCVDSVQARKDIKEMIKHMKEIDSHIPKQLFYWIDTGNEAYTGQVILSTVRNIRQPQIKQKGIRKVQRLPDIFKRFPEMNTMKDTEGASCSIIDSFHRQSYFINPFMAMYAARLVWEMLTSQYVSVCGYFVNLETDKIKPLPV